MEKSDQIVLPGDKIAVLEEFMAGEGAYEADGAVYASTVGKVEKDMRNRVVMVRPLNPPLVLQKGDMVYGRVTDIRSPIITVEILKVKGFNRGVSGDHIASLHISKVSKGYTTDIRDDVRIGDVIIAEVAQVKPSLQLFTARAHLGVVRARCAKCRGYLVKKGRDLYCPKCEHTEPRKLAKDYDLPPV